MNHNTGRTIITLGFNAQLHARPGMGINEAREKYLKAHEHAFPEFKGKPIMDYGDKKQPTLLVANERHKMVAYELVPEMTDIPGFTFEKLMAEMRKRGMDVCGEGPRTAAGRRTVLVCETEILGQ